MRKGQHQSESAKQKLREARAKQVHPSLVARGITAEMLAEATANGLRWCPGECKAFVPRTEFSSDATPICKKCGRISNNRWRARCAPERRSELAAATKEWRDKTDPDYERRWRLQREYGVTPEWYDEKLAEQGGHCALCPATTVKGKRYLFIDHNHATGKARGVLCYRCNTFLSQIENPGWLSAALAYLARYS